MQRLRDVLQIQNITLKKACNTEMSSRTLKVITIYYTGCIQISLPVSGLLLQHLYLSLKYYHFSSVRDCL